MVTGAPFVVLDKSEDFSRITNSSDLELIETELDVLGQSLCLRIAASNEPIKLSGIVPLAHIVCARIISAVERHIISSGNTIACRPKCSNCCRYLVPVTVPEAMWLTETARKMAQSDRRVLYEFSLFATRRILELTSKHYLSRFSDVKAEAAPKLKQLSDWYSSLNLSCPFLENDLCMLYEQRPIACREHLALGAGPNGCERNCPEHVRRVRMPVSVAEALEQLTNDVECKPVETIVLPFVFAWCRANRDYFERTWPAARLVSRFINILVARSRQPPMGST